MNVLYAVLLGAAFTIIELLIGGSRLVFSLPAYGLLAVAALASLADLRRAKLPPDGPCLASAAVFFGYLLVRALLSRVAYIAWDDEFAVAGCLVVYLLTACYLTDPRRRTWVLGVWMALAVVNLVVGARQFAVGDGFMLFGFVRSPQYLERASGLYICPDHLAGLLEMMACLGLAMACHGRLRVWARVLFGYSALMCLAGLLIAASRGGFVSVGAGLGVFTLLSLGRLRATSPEWFGRAVLLVIALAGLGALGVAAILPRSHLLDTRIRGVADIRHDDRPKLWAAALAEYHVSPVFGTGAATYLYYGRKFRDPSIQADPIRAHSDYLELLAEYGLVGAVGCALFLAAHARWGWRAYRRLSLRRDHQPGGSNAAAWNIGALAAVTCLAVHSAVDFNLHIPANALLLAFVFGVLANPGRTLDPHGEKMARLRRVDLVPRLAIPALGVWLAVAAVTKLPGEYFGEQARLALRDGHTARAMDLALRGIARQQSNPLLYYYLGQARQRLAGDGENTPAARSFRLAAAEAYGAALRLAPMDVTILVQQGQILTRLGDFDSADDIFRRVRYWDPHSHFPEPFYEYYVTARGLLPGAEAIYDANAAFDPDSEVPPSQAERARARAATTETPQNTGFPTETAP